MRSQLNKDIQALCLQFNTVYKLLKDRKASSSKRDAIYMFLLNNNPETGLKPRLHYPDFTSSSQHDRFKVEFEINKLQEKLHAIAHTLSGITKTEPQDLCFTLTFHKLYSSAAHIFLDTPSKRINRVKTTQPGRYDILEQGLLDNLDIIAPTPQTS